MPIATRFSNQTMNSYRRSNRSVRSLLAATFVVLGLLLADLLTGGSLKNIARSTSAVLWRKGSSISSAVFDGGLFATRQALVDVNETLKQKIVELELRSASYRALEQDNSALRSLVKLATENPGITLPVVSSLRASPYGTFMIGGGSSQGVSPGGLVLLTNDAGSFVVGVVSEVGSHVSAVKEVFAPSTSVGAVVKGIPVTVEGRGGGNARARLPTALSVGTGDIVRSAQFGGRAIGVVGSLKEDAAHSQQEIFIRIPVNFSDLRYVYVIPSGR